MNFKIFPILEESAESGKYRLKLPKQGLLCLFSSEKPYIQIMFLNIIEKMENMKRKVLRYLIYAVSVCLTKTSSRKLSSISFTASHYYNLVPNP